MHFLNAGCRDKPSTKPKPYTIDLNAPAQSPCPKPLILNPQSPEPLNPEPYVLKPPPEDATARAILQSLNIGPVSPTPHPRAP